MNVNNLIRVSALAFIAVFVASCSSDKQFQKQLAKNLQANPQLVAKLIEENPELFMSSLEVAARSMQKSQRAASDTSNKSTLKKFIKNPLEPETRLSVAFKGNKDAPITIVEYSDFQCGFCTRAHGTIEALMKKYPGKIKLIYKHLPLNFHPQAMISAQYFEAIKLQSMDNAFNFHNKVFLSQSKLNQGEKFLDTIAKNLKVDMIKLKNDIASDRVKNKIKDDIKEAQKFGFQGTPGFIVNGIPVKGAYPAEHFEMIFKELKKQGKLVM